jgi:hypothetical protein
LALIQVIKNLKGRVDQASIAVLGTRVPLEGRANLEMGVKSKTTHELKLGTIGLYIVQPIFKDEDSQMKNG